jgi:gas vesicle protein
MGYEYDRMEREDGGGSFLMGLLAGTVLGAGLGMLFAPKAGAETRRQLSEQANRLRSTAGDTYSQASEKLNQTYSQASDKINQASEKVSQMVDRGREAYERAKTSAATPGTPGSLGNTGTAGGYPASAPSNRSTT